MRNRRLRILGATILLTSCMFLFSTFGFTPHAYAATAQWGDFPSAECHATTSGTGWKMAKHGGYIGLSFWDSEKPCDGSYPYVHTPTRAYATWGIRGSQEASAYLWVYLPTDRAGATSAVYTVKTETSVKTFTINQRKAAGWYKVGKFALHGYSVIVTVKAAPGSTGDLLVNAIHLTSS